MTTGEGEEERTAKLLTNLWTVLIAAGVVLFGLMVLWWANVDDWFEDKSGTRTLVQQLAGLLITTGGLALLWDLRGRRDIMREIFAKVELGADVRSSGLERASMDWRVVPWADLITGSRQIDVFIAYGSTWLSSNHTELVEFSQKRRNKLRYILPDPSDDLAMQVLAERFDYTPEMIRSKVNEAAAAVAKLSKSGNADIRVWFRRGAPTFTCYRFDDQVVVTLYQHRVGRGPVPTLVVDRGTFQAFFESDLHAIISQSREVGADEILGGSNGTP